MLLAEKINICIMLLPHDMVSVRHSAQDNVKFNSPQIKVSHDILIPIARERQVKFLCSQNISVASKKPEQHD